MSLQWVVTKYDDFGEPLMRKLVEVPDPPKTYDELIKLYGEALI